MKIPLVDLGPTHAEIGEAALRAVAEVAKSGQFVLGEGVARFERRLAEMCEARHAVGVASCTDALVLALLAVGVGEGHLVVTTPLTFAATAEAIARVGARPIFCDVDAETLNLSPASVRARLERLDTRARAAVRAVIPVHLFGRACDMDALLQVAHEHDLHVIEDAAQAIGARAGGRPVGGIGAAGCFSFFPSKNLGAWGDGGALVTSDDALAARVRRVRAHGIESGRLVEIGMNSRLDAIQAAVLEVKCTRLEAWTRARVEAAERYRALLAPLEGRVRAPRPGAAGAHVFHQYVVRAERRDALAEHLAQEGIASRAYYATPLHAERCYADADAAVPEATRASREILALPFFVGITDEQQEHVARGVASFYEALQ